MMKNILQWIVVLILPWALAGTIITLVVRPWYPRFEYAKADFPPDPFGFTQEQRLSLALVAVEYLQSKGSAEETIYLLRQQTLPDGSGKLLYNEGEIQHMIDVKHLTDTIRTLAWGLGLVATSICVYFLYRRETTPLAYFALRRGGLVTVAMLVAIGVFLIFGWETFFVKFHELLFANGTWTFPMSDSLIRLFPERFWFDVGVLIVGGTLLSGILIAAAGHWLYSHR